MKIGIDIRPLQTHSGYRGIGRYLYEVLYNLPDEAKKNLFVFYYDPTFDLPNNIIGSFPNTKIIKVRNNKVSKIKFIRAFFAPHTKVKPSPEDIDVFFQAEASFGIPSTVPCVAVFMDLIPLLFKMDHKDMGLSGISKYKQIIGQRVQEKIYKSILRSYSNAARIIAISESSKRDYGTYIDSELANNIFVTPLAISSKNMPMPDATKSKTYLKELGLEKHKYILYVGAVDQRKNIKSLPIILSMVKKVCPGIKLVAVGKEFGIEKELSKVGWDEAVISTKTANDIVSPGYVDDTELNILYRNAGVFIFPSLYEGFGLPLLEAMGQSCPVICFNNSSIPEVAGDAAIMVDNVDEMVMETTRLLVDNKLRDELIKKGLEQVKKFSWAMTAQKTYEIIKNAAKK